MNTKISEDWSYNHFVAFLLLYGAYADLDYSSREKKLILRHVDKEVLDAVEHQFDEMSDFEQLNLLTHLSRKYITTSQDRLKVKSLLNDLWQSDGEVTFLESNLGAFLDRFLQLDD